MISPTEKVDGDGQGETDEPTKSKDDTKMTGDDMVWIKPEGPYTPDCPIGNPYCKYGQGRGAGWMCWEWAEIHNKEMAKLQRLAVLVNEDWAICRPDDDDDDDNDDNGDGIPLGLMTPGRAAVVAQMLSHHKKTLNELFNQGGEDVVVENLFQEGVWWTSGEPREVIGDQCLDAQADWFDYLEDEYWREPQEAERESRQQESQL